MGYALGFLGFGTMAQAICSGILDSGHLSKSDIVFTQRNKHKAQENAAQFGISELSAQDLMAQCNTLILGVKPQQLSDVSDLLSTFSGKVLVSLLAGTSLQRLSKSVSGTVYICRSMPNTPALLGKGLTGLSFSKSCTHASKNAVQKLFEGVGKTLIIEESGMDALTAVSGSGPAFMYMIADIIAQTAAKNGLDFDLALQAVSHTLIGSGHMLLESGASPQTLVQAVKSPNGTTSAGLECLEHSQFAEQLSDIISASIARSKELGAI